MTDNNYKAPESLLLDPPEPELPERPRNVNIALCLIGGGLLVRLLAGLRFLQEANFQIESPWPWAISIAGLVLYGVMCHQIAHGRNWARLLLLLFTLVTFMQLCWAVGYIWRRAPDMWEMLFTADYLLGRVLPMAINMAALHLLFFSSGDWFRRR